jgi:HK97 gp10 family phage protein
MASGLFIYHPEVERDLLFSAQARELVDRAGERIAAQAAADAPHRTGAGAASIDSQTRLTPHGWEARVSWTRRHYYMYFHERGTVRMPARPFLRPAIDKARGRI